MKQSVVIKSSKSGMTLVLDSNTDFETIVNEVKQKFTENARFWGNVQMTLTIEGRKVTPQEELTIVNAITDHSQVEILCLLDQNADRIEKCEKALNQKLMELSQTTGQFYKGELSRGDTLESETSIVIVGDVHHGARVEAKGNVIILGELKGTVHAGISGSPDAVVVALDMSPMEISIGKYKSDFDGHVKRLGKGSMIACIEDRSIVVKSLKKSFFEMLNSI